MSMMFRMPISCYETGDYGWIKQQKVNIHHSTLSSAAVGNGLKSARKKLRLQNTVLGMWSVYVCLREITPRRTSPPSLTVIFQLKWWSGNQYFGCIANKSNHAPMPLTSPLGSKHLPAISFPFSYKGVFVDIAYIVPRLLYCILKLN